MPSPEMIAAKKHAAGIQVLKPAAIPGPEDSPAQPSAAYTRQKPAWKRLRDVYAGTQVLRKEAQAYVPKGEAEETIDYDMRVARTEAFNGLKRTIRGLVGMVFRRVPQLDEAADPQITAHWENIDGAGTAGDIFCQTLMQDALLVGLGGVLVDMPAVPGPRTQAQETAGAIRPYWVHYLPEAVLSYRTETTGGETYFSQVVLHESLLEPDGEFGEQPVERYRIFRLQGPTVLWELWEGRNNQPPQVVGEGVVQNQRRIPFSPLVLGDRLDLFESAQPPLTDLADTVLAHFNVRSDHRYSMHKASVPILTIIGGGDEDPAAPVKVGVNAAVRLPIGGDMKYTEHSGSALGATAEELKELKQEMAALGLAMLQQETRSAETAEAKKIDKADQDSALARAARQLEDCLEQAFTFHALYLGVPAPGISVNQDFEAVMLDAATISSYAGLVRDNILGLDTMWQVLAEGNALPRDFDPEKERVAVENQQAQALERQLETEQAMASLAPAAGTSGGPPGFANQNGTSTGEPPMAGNGPSSPAAAPMPAPAPAPPPAPDPALAAALDRLAEAVAGLGAAAPPPAPVAAEPDPVLTALVAAVTALVAREPQPAPPPAAPAPPSIVNVTLPPRPTGVDVQRDAEGRMTGLTLTTEGSSNG